MLRPRKKPDRRICRITFPAVFAMLAAMFTLVTWATPFSFILYGTSVDLPIAKHSVQLGDSQRDDALVIAILRDGMVFLSTERVVPEVLIAKLRERVHAGAPRIVYIRADSRVHYRKVKDVLDGVHSAGLTNVAFMTEQQKAGEK